MPDIYRISFSRAALERLASLSAEQRARLEEMLGEIGGHLADRDAAGGPSADVQRLSGQLLSLHVGRATVRYTVDPAARTLEVQHLLVYRPVPLAVAWAPQAAAQLAAVHPDVRRHIAAQIAQIAELAAADMARNLFRREVQRDRVWSFEGHSVHYVVDGDRFSLTVARVVAPEERSAG